MPLAITDVITPRTADEIETEILSLCVTAELPVTSWESGGVVLTMIRIIAEAIAAKDLVDVEIAKGGLGDFASPSWAKIWADKIYNVQFAEAEPATGTVDATNTEPTIYDLDPGDLIVAHSVTGKTYRNQSAISIPANGSLADIEIAADEVGTGSNAAPGEITVMVTSLVGVTVTNPSAVLGSDEETTPQLVSRSRNKLALLSPLGPKGIYDYVVQTPELTATSSRITRSRTVADEDTGAVSVYIANADGAPTSPDVDIAQAAVDKWAEPWTVTATVVAAVEHSIDITYRVWINTSLTAEQVESEIEIALVNYLASVQVGGVVIPPDLGAIYLEKLTYIIHTAVPGIERVEITVPADDVTLSPNEVAVIGTVTPTVTIL